MGYRGVTGLPTSRPCCVTGAAIVPLLPSSPGCHPEGSASKEEEEGGGGEGGEQLIKKHR